MVTTWIGDLGNSGIKLCAFKGDRPGKVRRFYGKNAILDAARVLRRQKVPVLHAACANPARERELRAALRKTGTECVPVRKKRPANLFFRYDFNRLGLDRIADAAAARADYPDKNLIILDFGTALTVNVIEGRTFAGGFIVPGLSVMLNALSGRAPALPEIRPGYNRPVFARTTKDAMDSGTRLMFLLGIAGLVRWVGRTRRRSYRVIATGGGLPLLSQLPFRATRDETLTLRGLKQLV